MNWGVCNDAYLNLDIDLTILNKILVEYVLPQFGEGNITLDSVGMCKTVTTTGFSGDVYNEVVEIVVSTKNIKFYFVLLIEQLDIIFKLLGLSPQDYRLRYRYK